MTVRWPRQAGGRRIQGHYHGKVVGTLQKWPAKAGGRSPKGPAVAGTTVLLFYHSRISSSTLCMHVGKKMSSASESVILFFKGNMRTKRKSHRPTAPGVGHSIVLPSGSLQTNKIPAILGRYPLLGFFCRLKTVPLDRDNGTFNSSNTDMVEKVNFLVAA